MDQTDQKKQAWLTSLRMLAATPKSRKQLEKKLIDKGYFAEVVEEILNRLEETHILNDKAYATNVMSRYQGAKSSGRKRIEFELKKRGVSGKVREELLSEISGDDERVRARELADNRWDRFKNLEFQKRKKKVYDFLCRRGFDFQIARECLDQVVKESKEGDSIDS